jgi:hypothetical protein
MNCFFELRVNKHKMEARRKSRAAQHREREQMMEFHRDLEEKRRHEEKAGGSLRTRTRPTLNRPTSSARSYEHSP